jgi:hypothetical protein
MAFACTAPFGPDQTHAALVERYGASNIATDQVSSGEGFFETGTVLFPDDPARRVGIAWQDTAARRRPKWVRIEGERSVWRTPSGITLGTSLTGIERLNGRPFRLAGFSWDYAGTVLSWAGGALEPAADAACRVIVRLQPSEDADDALANQVQGDGEYSSGHPAMQALDPRVYQIMLSFE